MNTRVWLIVACRLLLLPSASVMVGLSGVPAHGWVAQGGGRVSSGEHAQRGSHSPTVHPISLVAACSASWREAGMVAAHVSMPPGLLTHDDGAVDAGGVTARAAHHHRDLEPQLGGRGGGVGEGEGSGLRQPVCVGVRVAALHLLANL